MATSMEATSAPVSSAHIERGSCAGASESNRAARRSRHDGAAAGVPVVDTMGARGGAIHSPDEFLLLDSLVERAALSALTILAIAERGRL